jgi:hypothetical protein
LGCICSGGEVAAGSAEAIAFCTMGTNVPGIDGEHSEFQEIYFGLDDALTFLAHFRNIAGFSFYAILRSFDY